MAINASIPLGVQPMQLQMPDPNAGMNALARALQIRDLQQSGQMNALSLQEKQRGIAETNALNEAYKGALGPDGTPDRAKLFQTLAGQGLGSRIPGLQKQFLDADTAGATLKKTQAETQKSELEQALKKAEHASSVLSLAKDPQTYATVRAVVKSQFGQDLPEQFDPVMVQAIIAQGQTLTQRLAAEHQRLTLAETGRHNVATEGLTARGQNITMRGQNMVDARSRENAEIQRNQPRGQFIETTNGYVLADPKTGAVRPVMGADGQPLKGKAADRQMTDAQAKANLFGSRMSESHRILTELEGKYSPMAVNAKMGAAEMPLVGGVAGYAGNMMLSQEGQQAEQAQRDFINAVLRRESGAVISPTEFSNGQKQYFPQPGDTKAVLDQKRRNRELAIKGMEAEVPGGFRNMPSLTNTGQQGGSGGRSASGKVIDFGDLK